MEAKKQLLKVARRAMAKGRSEGRSEALKAIPRVPPEDAEMQDSASSLAREVGMEGLVQLRAMIGTAGGVDGLQKMVSRSARVESLLADGGLEDEKELRTAISLVEYARKHLELPDGLEGAIRFMKSAVIMGLKVGNQKDLKKAIDMFLSARQATNILDVKKNNEVIEKVNKMLAIYKEVGGLGSLQDKVRLVTSGCEISF